MRELERQTGPMSAVETPPSESAVTLVELFQRARNSSGQERLWLATLINQRLKKVVDLPEPEQLVSFLIEQLDDHGFAGLKDKKGWPCRAAVVEAVIELGYPHALQLDPEDVAYLQTEKLNRPVKLVPLRISAVLGALGLVGVAGLVTGGPTLDALCAAALGLGHVGLLVTHPRSQWRRALEVSGVAGAALLAFLLSAFGQSAFRYPNVLWGWALVAVSSVALSVIEWRAQPR